MKIGVIGLGLMGGSFCKAISRYTSHHCFGYDIDPAVVEKAYACGAIHEILALDHLVEMDITIVCLHPVETIDFLTTHVQAFRSTSIVLDTCGVKKYLMECVEPVFAEQGVDFVGGHPMAGREHSGFDYATHDLFQQASFIICPTKHTAPATLLKLKDFFRLLGFSKVVTTTPQHHDRVIAFSSQLAHILSNAYVKSKTIEEHHGFSAGSFQDLTRVAILNEQMWADLFLMNQTMLEQELEILIAHLQEYQTAIQKNDRAQLVDLLRKGREQKQRSLKADPL